MRCDVLISGAGLVGLATALQLTRSNPRLRVVVLEKEDRVAAHQSSRNSGVIHSGIYYRPGSLRAVNCRRGYGLLLQFCREHGIPHEICGKIIVAVEEKERASLRSIYERGLENGLSGIRLVGGAEARDMEPHVQAVEAVWVPQAGIVGYGSVARKYAEIIQNSGAEISLNSRVERIRKYDRSLTVTDANGREWECRIFVNCTGLYSDRTALLSGIRPPVQILPFRGEYYELVPAAEHLVRNLIYPVPNPRFPFLGVHFTRMVDGSIEAGPNAVLAFQREGYSKWDIKPRDLCETLLFSGFQKLARKYWRDGWAEMQRSYSKKHFLRALQRLVPALGPGDIRPGRTGVRAMACDTEGNMLDDFLILDSPRVVNVCNAPSPAATASLAIGETVAKHILALCSC